ncbi:MAG: Na+/H+ antiporter NhaC family protein, partial [Planctomycetes bacterium]|nr:Na+/H+ antiporter NhaC family protein [Planctomycetota bacterium]
ALAGAASKVTGEDARATDLGGQEAGAAAKLEIRWPRAGPFFLGTRLDLEIIARSADGEIAADFAGRATVEGVLRDGRPVELSPSFSRGVIRLESIELDTGRVVARAGDLRTESSRRLLPGFLTLLPPLTAIALALLTRQVLLSLFAGIWIGVFLLADCSPLASLLRSADTYLVGALADPGHVSILLFSLTLAGMIGIITRSGGVRGIVDVVARRARGPRSGQVAAWALGLVIFFDDYANSLLVGNTMRPFTDRVRISREKLSFIVDATAAPVATIGVISTWTAYQVGLIAGVLPGLPSETQEPYLFFLRSIPGSFYSFIMIFIVFLTAWTLRDFGPMRRAEERCRRGGGVLRPGAQPLADPSLDQMGDAADVRPRWHNAAIPIALVVLLTLVGLYATGRQAIDPARRSVAGLREIFGAADAYRSLLWAALGSSIIAGLLARLQGLALEEIVRSWVSGARSLMLAAMILVLAWAISDVCRDVRTGDYVMALSRGFISPRLVPAIAFATAGVIAFSTGTSYGTMAILIPIFLPLAYRLAADAGLDPSLGDRLGVGALAAILGGSVFGDHCSPISDTTVLSSMASGADHVDHVRTQLPYALLGAVVAFPCYLLLGLGVPSLLVLPAGLAAAAGAFFLLARRRR